MGYWDNQGATPTKVTWSNPQFVSEGSRSNGGWYYNPGSGYVERWWTGQQQQSQPSQPSSGGSSGGGGDNRQAQLDQAKRDQDALLAKQEADRLAKEAAFKKEEEGLITDFQTKSGGQETMSSAYTRLSGEQNVPGITTQLTSLRDEVGKVKGLLDTLEEDVTSRTSGKLVSESQRKRILASEEAPLRNQLGRLATGQQIGTEALSLAYGAVGQGLTNLTADQQKELQPLMIKMSAFSDRAAREYSGFQVAQQRSLDTLLSQITRGQQIADQDWQKASALALSEKQYNDSLTYLTKQTDEQIRQTLATKGAGSSTPLANLSYDEFKKMFQGGGTTEKSGTTTPSTYQQTLDSIFG